MSSAATRFATVILGLLTCAGSGLAQAPPSSVPDLPTVTNSLRVPELSKSEPKPYEIEPGEDPHNELFRPFLFHLANDQKQFWLSPKKLSNPEALKTFIPFVGFTGLLFASDRWITRQVPDKPNQLKMSKNISDYAAYSMLGAAGGAFVLGHWKGNDHLSETGLLAGEAAINSTAVTYAFKEITRRQRPLDGNGNGDFFKGGASFSSEHAAIAWSIASVVAHEYPGPLTKFGAYGLASAVTLTRITGKQHFASDAFVGSVLGWYLGRQIFRAHHDAELGGTAWGDFLESSEKGERRPENMASPYVPPDSWVYPAFERLAALGYVQTGYLGMRPWTRMECARLIEESDERIAEGNPEDNSARKWLLPLSQEFSAETARLNGAANVGITLDSVYTRLTTISGTPLRDGYHFGQTITNDYGRPYGEGLNSITGFSTHAVAGPLTFYVRGEYQHAPGTPPSSFPTLQAIATADATTPISNGNAGVDRFRIVESLVGLNVHNFQISFGKQSFWLGNGESGSLLLSNNAESILALRIDNVSPYRIPLLSNLLGPVRSEFFIGQLQGHQFELNGTTLVGPGNINPQPYLHGYKISFKPTPNLEFGMGITAQFAGPGLPFTWSNFIRTFYVHNQTGPTVNNANPGKRLSAFDFSYRVPGLRKWLTIYNDSLVVDEISPIGSSRPTLNPGIYLPQIPKLPKMEFRAEGLRDPLTTEFAPGFVYYGVRRYRSGYTNEGNLLGSWLGRAGRGGQAWATYSLSPRSRVQLGYRHQEVSKSFIGGGRAVDYSARGEFMLGPDIALTGFLQYEQWKFPVLQPGPQSNLTTTVQLTFHTNLRIIK